MAKAPLDVEDLNFEQLGDQQLREVMARIKEAHQERFTGKLQEFREVAREAGYTVTLHKIGKEDVRQSRRQAPEEDRRRGVSPKYRSPDNPEETWAGRGREPKWVEERLASGSSLDDLLISREAPQENFAASEGVYAAPSTNLDIVLLHLTGEWEEDLFCLHACTYILVFVHRFIRASAYDHPRRCLRTLIRACR